MLITLLLGFLFFAFVGKLLRVIMWGAMAGPAMIGPSMAWDGIGGSWRHPRHRAHGPVRPWYGPWCGQPGESPETSEDTQDLEA
jgi:hypothetical protein